jgi:NitT/TauT family transport system substrate-binding protein
MKERFWAIWMVIFALGLLGMSGGPVQKAYAAEPLHFGYLVADQLHSPGPMIMKEKGFLKDEGFEVKWSEFLAGAYAMQHFSAGEVDAVSCGAVPMMIARGSGTNVVMLASANTEGSALVVLPEIKSVKDLQGQKVGSPGLGSIQDAMLSMVEKQHNVRFQHVPIKVSDMPIYLNKKEIRGFISWEPNCSRAVDMGYGKILLTSHDMLPGHQCCVLAVQGKMIQQNPAKVKRILKAYLRALDYANQNREETIKLMSKYTNLSEGVVKAALPIVKNPYPPYVDKESLKVMAELLIDTGKIEKEKVPDLNKLLAEVYNETFLKEAVGGK